jgi:glycosyltransferase involved in cell wall biosynthesis
MASTNRLLNIGRLFVNAGYSFQVIHVGSSRYSQNVLREGIIDGIGWVYLTWSMKWAKQKWRRVLNYLYAGIILPFTIYKYRKNKYILMIYSQGDVANLYYIVIGMLLGVPIIQECCEWWPGTTKDSIFVRLMYEKVMFKMTTGAIAISGLIEERIRKNSVMGYPVLKIPSLYGNGGFMQNEKDFPLSIKMNRKYVLWSGLVDEYKRDPELLIYALSKKPENKYRMVVSGICSEGCKEYLLDIARKSGLNEDCICIVGYVDENEYLRLVYNSSALFIPLWDDDRSRTRFPDKTAIYLTSGRPIITCPIGEIGNIFSDDRSAFFYEPGSPDSLSDTITRVLENPEHSSNVGKCGRDSNKNIFDYHSYTNSLVKWLNMVQQ